MEIINTIVLIIVIALVTIIISNYIKWQEIKEKLSKLKEKLENTEKEKCFFKKEFEKLQREISEIERKKITSNNKKTIFKDKKVLVGDYNEEMLKHTKKVLIELGFEVDTVTSGDDIIDRINYGYKYDVIITNNTYKEGVSGITMTKILKEKEDFVTPIVVLTVSDEGRDYFLEYYDEYLQKYLTKEAALEVLTKLLLPKKNK